MHFECDNVVVETRLEPPRVAPRLLGGARPTVEEAKGCQFHRWYKLFGPKYAGKVVSVELEDDFVDYLLADGLTVPEDSRAVSLARTRSLTHILKPLADPRIQGLTLASLCPPLPLSPYPCAAVWTAGLLVVERQLEQP